MIKDKKEDAEVRTLKFVDNRLLATPPVALMQVKKEIDYMLSLVEINTVRSFTAMETGSNAFGELISENEAVIDFTNSALTKFLIKLSAEVDRKNEKVIGAYFHVLNDLERIGDHAENFHEIGMEMKEKGLEFSEIAKEEIAKMRKTVMDMLAIAKDAFENLNKDGLPHLTELENEVDGMKKALTANHFARLAEGACHVELSPYYSSTVAGLERVADHIVNVGYSIMNPTGSQKEAE